MKKVGNWFAASWTELLFSFILLLGVVVILWFGIGDILPGLSKQEVSQAATSNTIQEIIDNPLGAPHKGLQYITQKLLVGSLGVRSASALIGLGTIFCFYFVLRNWYSKRVALLGTITFATSAWFLHSARAGTDESMYFLLFGAAACLTWLKNSRGSLPAVLASAILVILLLYTPGMIWLVIPALLWQAATITQLLEKRNPIVLAAVSLLAFAALVPIGWAMYQNHELIRTYFGLPQTLPEPLDIAKNILNVPVELFVRGPNDPASWLARLPLLTAFATVTFVIGLYAFFRKRKLDRTWFTAFVFIAGTVLASLEGPVPIEILLPFIFLVCASGLALLLQQWFTVFPRNPFARSAGTILVTVVTLLAAYQGVSQYFIAWPNAPETKQEYQEKFPPQ